jgi:multicomponent Na+:H+ antiporter subunit B
MITGVDITLLVLLGVTAISVIRVRNLFAATMLMGIYSLLSAGLFVTMDAMDVAFTEAAVGAGISTILMLGTLALVGSEERAPTRRPILPLFVTLVVGGVLIFGSLDMPAFGDPSNPVHQHVAPYYLEESYEDTGIPNIVTVVLGSYRGYDTMGEGAVVFTALVGVLLLLARGRQGGHRTVDLRPGAVDSAATRKPSAGEESDHG